MTVGGTWSGHAINDYLAAEVLSSRRGNDYAQAVHADYGVAGWLGLFTEQKCAGLYFAPQ